MHCANAASRICVHSEDLGKQKTFSIVDPVRGRLELAKLDTPGANIKAVAEYQFRPGQSVMVATNPITGLPMAVNSFHTNTLVLGFEFVY